MVRHILSIEGERLIGDDWGIKGRHLELSGEAAKSICFPATPADPIDLSRVDPYLKGEAIIVEKGSDWIAGQKHPVYWARGEIRSEVKYSGPVEKIEIPIRLPTPRLLA